ncbi:MAG TPA: Mrp/NBP35 family ATP-binding protein [Alphaproteobacteria bacterium]|nr:Mrp/NBP35 family ATP-binding protein [Alphaproteobacteria bacterium]
MSLESQIISALKTLVDPLSGQDIVTCGALQGLNITSSGTVSFALEVNTEHMHEGIKIKEKATSLLEKIPGVMGVQIALTAQRKAKAHNPSAKRIQGIKYVIVVGSGKGGVGKSTTAVNLACSLQLLNLKVGILDADIYGPSLPKLLGINQKPTSDDGSFINPLEAHGLKCMSLGFMIDEKMPTIWRGPMVQKALHQMLRQVKWGDLDVLVIDLPPGTGDVHLTLAQTTVLSGAIIVSTPQDLALIDARKGLEMFLKVNVPILGLVENMSYFLCPHCQTRSEIFEHGGMQKEAQVFGVPLLAEIPLHMAIREASEKGRPLVLSSSPSLEGSAYLKLGQRVWASLCSSNDVLI